MSKVTGLRGVLKGMAAAKKRHAAGFARGIKKAALFVQRQSMLRVPIDLGNLRASAFTRFEKTGRLVTAWIGYTAKYAIWVHEIPSPFSTHGKEYNTKHADDIRLKRKYWYNGVLRTYRKRGENQTYKFLQTPFVESQKQIQDIIAEETVKK